MRGLYRRNDSKYWWCCFTFRGHQIKKSTRCLNLKDAEQVFDRIKRSFSAPISTMDPDWPVIAHRRISDRARKKGLDYELSPSILETMFSESQGCCQFSGIPFSWEEVKGARTKPWVPSVDRVDSRDGYTQDNTRLVCWCVNRAMADWGEEVLKRLLSSGYIPPKNNVRRLKARKRKAA